MNGAHIPSHDWHYFATRLNGDGTETLIANEIPLEVDSFTHALSAPNTMTATLPVEVAHLKDDDGRPILHRWSTAIYAEKDDVIRFGGIVTDIEMEDQRLTLTVEGFHAYLYGMPYMDDDKWVQTDPLVLARHIWQYVQSFDGGNLAMVLDETTSPIRVGTETEDVEFETGEGNQVSFEAGPYRLNYYTTHDLGRAFDDLAEVTPFDYAERHEWTPDGDIRHYLRLGYPALGRVRDDLRFVVGENIYVVPVVEQDGDEYASDVLVLGAGEGHAMVRGHAEVNQRNGLRRVAVLTDKSAQSVPRAESVARAELNARTGAENVTSLVMFDHPNAPIGALEVGDVIKVEGSGTGWAGDLYLDLRVLEITTAPNAETATLTTTAAERT